MLPPKCVLILLLCFSCLGELRLASVAASIHEDMSISMTSEELCYGCFAFAEEFLSNLNGMVIHAEEYQHFTVDAYGMLERMCNTGRYEQMTDKYQASCVKMVKEHTPDFMEGLQQQITIHHPATFPYIRRYKQRCVQIGVCTKEQYRDAVGLYPHEDTEENEKLDKHGDVKLQASGLQPACHACIHVMKDVSMILARKLPRFHTPERALKELDEVCYHIGMRHRDSDVLRLTCTDIMDEHDESIASNYMDFEARYSQLQTNPAATASEKQMTHPLTQLVLRGKRYSVFFFAFFLASFLSFFRRLESRCFHLLSCPFSHVFSLFSFPFLSLCIVCHEWTTLCKKGADAPGTSKKEGEKSSRRSRKRQQAAAKAAKKALRESSSEGAEEKGEGEKKDESENEEVHQKHATKPEL